MRKIEYKTEVIWDKSRDEVEAWLNEQGQDGWKLITIKQRYDTENEEYLFEREIV